MCINFHRCAFRLANTATLSLSHTQILATINSWITHSTEKFISLQKTVNRVMVNIFVKITQRVQFKTQFYYHHICTSRTKQLNQLQHWIFKSRILLLQLMHWLKSVWPKVKCFVAHFLYSEILLKLGLWVQWMHSLKRTLSCLLVIVKIYQVLNGAGFYRTIKYMQRVFYENLKSYKKKFFTC